jgi:hypothetical protein
MNLKTRIDAEADARVALQRLRRDLGSSGGDPQWPRAVVGSFDARGNALYGYPEIAGYWLRWASAREDVGDRGGNAVVNWLIRLYARHLDWPTRVAAGVTQLDRAYGDADYLFDHIMLWDGLRQWGRARRATDALRVADLVWERSQSFVQGGHLLAGHGALSPRWSGQVGPFLLKVCARVRDRTSVLSEACARAVPALITAAVSQPHEEAHPQLYAIEGMLELGLTAPASAALQALITAHGGLAGLRESCTGGARRLDVLAQVLRAGCLLGLARRDAAEWIALAHELAAAIDFRGRLPFAVGSELRPTWTALFAEQALSLWFDEAAGELALV